MAVPQVADGGAGFGRRGCVTRPVSSRAATMLRRADELLSEAAGTRDAAERFQLAYLAALRGAGAVLAVAEVRAGQVVRRARTRNAWVLMAKADPGFARWADFFADRSETRAAIESGITRTLPADEADRFYGEVGSFLHEVEDCLSDRVTVPE
ncbi:SAV_6107 family HEPN domain-containing protein [Rhodococcus sp. O3]|uniref:SAV_6107 family HEPN domain-containing protein n=1 Tax=Rhodococcus sp. O3 TaxID=3404919 RepID=UPI003B67E7EC